MKICFFFLWSILVVAHWNQFDNISQKKKKKKRKKLTILISAIWWFLIYIINKVSYVSYCPFYTEPSPTFANECGEVTGCNASHQEVGMYSTRCILGNVHYICVHKKLNKVQPTLALKPRGEITRNLKQGYQWPPERTYVRHKFKKKKVHICIHPLPLVLYDMNYEFRKQIVEKI